ncbi:MAG: nickel pincer cofactor biosynthesis protein LarB [Candidatus Hermodarchaeota archaeon]|jgi:NCAIR mutase (PurE)-related protein|nr:nickel pincer cofactor biosynthesis protein LarB [Candidatus Hermodarchaeota archaeon]
MSELRDILEKLAKGKYSLDEAEAKLRVFNIVEVARLAKLDVCRDTRKGIPEVVYAQHKTIDDLLAIIEQGIQVKPVLILSQLSTQQQQAIQSRLRIDFKHKFVFEVYGDGAIAIIRAKDYAPKQTGGKIGIIAAGTSDRQIAEAARVMAEQMGCQVYMAHDVGVAGVHRLFPELAEMVEQGIDVLIVAAGMEGALPSLVTGLVDIPVIGLPIATGYGLGGEGLGALISMLQSCSLGLAVVNINNGVGAGSVAALIANRLASKSSKKPG